MCLFLNFCFDSEERIYIWVHVDDTFVAVMSMESLDEFEIAAKSQFKISTKSDVDLRYILENISIHFQTETLRSHRLF